MLNIWQVLFVEVVLVTFSSGETSQLLLNLQTNTMRLLQVVALILKCNVLLFGVVSEVISMFGMFVSDIYM